MIAEIAQMINGKFYDNPFELVRGVSINSSQTKPGDLFFALKGEHTDGHFFVKEALANGACAAVVEKGVTVHNDILVADTLYALGELARKYRRFSSATTIAVTGTNGKTTTKNLIGAIIKKKFKTMITEKNYNSLIGLPLTLLKINGEEDFLIVEMGTSNPGEIARLCEIAQPDAGVITNIGPGHLAGFHSIDEIKKEKLSLIEALPKDSYVLLGEGIDDLPGRVTARFSLRLAEDIELTEHGTYFTYQGNRFFVNLLGMHNVYNCIAALCVSSHFGIEYQYQSAALAEVKPEPGRMEPIRFCNLLILNDSYNANPMSMRAAIDFASQLGRPKIFILGDMLELGKQSAALHTALGDYARARCKLLLTMGKMARLYKGQHFVDKHALVRSLLKKINGEEVILIKASRGLHFEEIICELLRGL